MRANPIALLAAGLACALVWSTACSFDFGQPVCGYDKEPGPDYSCEGTVLVRTMNCPTTTSTRQDCAASGEKCLSLNSGVPGCARPCVLPGDCPAGDYCSPFPKTQDGLSICEPYVQAGQPCGSASECAPGLVCVAPPMDADAPDASPEADAPEADAADVDAADDAQASAPAEAGAASGGLGVPTCQAP